MKLISLFSGFGGFEQAADMMGWEVLVTCEINSFCRNLLKQYHPEAYHHKDIKTLSYAKINKALTKKYGKHWHTDDIVLCGGFPCQPYSVAGKRLGKDDERHLWPEMRRVIREIKPKFVVGENVSGIVSWNGGMVFEEVQADLENEGYEVVPFILPACAVGAPHRRDRVWFIAHRSNSRIESLRKQTKQTDQLNNVANTESIRKRKLRDAGEKTGPRESNQSSPGICGIHVSTDTTDEGLQERKQNNGFTNRKENEPGLDNRSERLSDMRSAADTTSSRGRKNNRQGESGFYDQTHTSNYWQNFPTESPICGGDDGFSTELLRQRIREDSMGHLSEKEIDKILSKALTEWRNETIKGFGNAVVPQVVLQIFESIQTFYITHYNNQ